MVRTGLLLAQVLGLLALAADARAGESHSRPGLRIGAKTTPFNVHDVTGAFKGKPVCYV
jgi:hypothetical protein